MDITEEQIKRLLNSMQCCAISRQHRLAHHRVAILSSLAPINVPGGHTSQEIDSHSLTASEKSRL